MSQAISVLVVDDEGCGLITPALRDHYHCITARSAMGAIPMLMSTCIKVVVADVGLPDLSGLEFYQIVNRISPQTLVILVSGDHDERAAAAAIEQGAFGYLGKPFNMAELLETVEHALRHQGERAAGRSVS